MKLRTFLFILLLCLPSLLSACGKNKTPSLMEAIDQAELQWQQQSVISYRIEVLTVQSIWHAQSQKITVLEGKIIEQSEACIRAPMETSACEVKPYQAQDYTVPRLFKEARWMADNLPVKYVKFDFDPQYGFPSQLSYNNPDIVDGDWGWRVMSFEILKEEK